MNVTPRQLDFLRHLYRLCQQQGGPVHYSDVAVSLGVNRFSAYDMLKLLQRKGLVASDYVLGPDHVGPGRSQIVFKLSPKGEKVLRSGETSEIYENGDDWFAFKDRILQRLRETSRAGYRDMLQDLLVRLPERSRPLHFCTELIAALLLNLEQVRAQVRGVNPVEALTALTQNGEAGLGTLAGLSLGSALATAQSRADRSRVEALYTSIQRYQAYLQTLSDEGKQRLSDFLQEAIGVVASRV
ncbi:MAG TPA: hypothetical protein EYP04_06000 [Anaerolineae bacterium]|nr:hypothetical protein [Anaerolineae bacterium]